MQARTEERKATVVRTLVSTAILIVVVVLTVVAAACGDVVQQAQDAADQVQQDVTQATKQQAQDYVRGVSDPMQNVVDARASLADARAAGAVSEPQLRAFATDVAQAANDLSNVTPPPGLDSLQQQLVSDLQQWAQVATANAAKGAPGAQQVLEAAPQISGWADALAVLCQAAGIQPPGWLTAAQSLDQVAQ